MTAPRDSLERSLRDLLADRLGCALLASADDGALQRLAADLLAADRYGDRRHLHAAAAVAGLDAAQAPQEIVAHALRCAGREARWRRGELDAGRFALRIEGGEWAQETADSPTIVLAPMTLRMSDAVAAIQATRRVVGPRELLLYGEDVDRLPAAAAAAVQTVAATRQGLRDCLAALDRGALLMTYADFVYDGHRAVAVPLFGRSRALSSGLLGLVARPGTKVLPTHMRLDGDDVVLHFRECLQFDAGEPARGDSAFSTAIQRELAEVLAQELESLIRIATTQWLLLPTLAFESPQMAVA